MFGKTITWNKNYLNNHVILLLLTFRLCIQELGYKGDIGYQTFLYNSEADLRRVFIFLIEKLPKESDKTLNEPITNIGLLEKCIAAAVSRGLSAPWLPHYCHTKGFRNRGRASIPYRSVNLEVPTTNSGEGDNVYLWHCFPLYGNAEKDRFYF